METHQEEIWKKLLLEPWLFLTLSYYFSDDAFLDSFRFIFLGSRSAGYTVLEWKFPREFWQTASTYGGWVARHFSQIGLPWYREMQRKCGCAMVLRNGRERIHADTGGEYTEYSPAYYSILFKIPPTCSLSYNFYGFVTKTPAYAIKIFEFRKLPNEIRFIIGFVIIQLSSFPFRKSPIYRNEYSWN